MTNSTLMAAGCLTLVGGLFHQLREEPYEPILVAG